jgi:hypothetical protein
MRRTASIGILLALAGCGTTNSIASSIPTPADYVGNPVSGIGGFIADTHTPFRNPNRPQSDAENVKQMTGQPVVISALLPESGNVWPGPFKPDPTLSDVAHSMDSETVPPAKPAKTP